MSNKPVRGAGKPKSAGGRPAQISRESILDVAQDLPSHSLTMPAVAKRLGVTRVALYRHFESRDDLLLALAERFASEMRVPPPNPKRWRTWLLAAIEETYRYMRAHPMLFDIREARSAANAGGKLFEAALETLEGAGFSTEEAIRVWRVAADHAYVEARAQLNTARFESASGPSVFNSELFEALFPTQPRTRAALAMMVGRDPERLFLESLRWLIDSLPSPTATKTRSRTSSR